MYPEPEGRMDPLKTQRGEAATKVLLLMLVVAIAGAVASPWLLRSRLTAEQAAAVLDLRVLNSAQQEQYGASRLYAELDRLVEAKMLDPGYRSKALAPRGYRLHHSTDGAKKRFCAEMVAKEIEGPTFAIDESGTVMRYEYGISPCYGGELRTAGTPVR